MTVRDDDVRRAAATIGNLFAMFVTGDPGPDDVAEYIAAGWLKWDDYYAEEGERTSGGITDSLITDLGKLSAALDRLAKDLDSGNITLDSLRRVELPR